ncbi:hypothetical protein P4U43_08040 [Arthrobacter sp. EH-1B-1]|uniref:Uncharacterized protein n=1 Tax=Arthrobacter vasquezii TaxID=2977629 RepID=A0ABT6CW61_9MICC|nr:hypothetical protein [Arthrobacter vasquezii]MDF9277737.1 hypothetical protein [Arthrobacter vasquezii]
MTRPTGPARGAEPAALSPVLWTEREPVRLARDQDEVRAFAPLLEYKSPADEDGLPHGGWVGELPRWPFERPQPEALEGLLGAQGLRVLVAYSAAHPMVPPTIYSIDPEPSVWEQTQSAWHVAPGGSLCLLQSDGGWQPEASITELLAKASGWRIEYALMKAGVIDRMSVNGIVSDPSYDHLIEDAVQQITVTTESADEDDTNVSQ